jgi:hypothetical protein
LPALAVTLCGKEFRPTSLERGVGFLLHRDRVCDKVTCGSGGVDRHCRLYERLQGRVEAQEFNKKRKAKDHFLTRELDKPRRSDDLGKAAG